MENNRVHIVDLFVDDVWERSTVILNKDIIYDAYNLEPEDAILGRCVLSGNQLLAIIQKFNGVYSANLTIHEVESWLAHENQIRLLTS